MTEQVGLFANAAMRLSETFRDSLVRNFAWFSLAEIVSRLSRIAVTVYVMRSLSAEDLGLAATAITCYELIRVLSRNGCGQYIARSTAQDLEAACATAYWLGWAMALIMCIMQCIAALAIGVISGKSDLTLLIASLSLSFLMMPQGLVQVALLLRNNCSKELALVASVQSVADSILTIILAFNGFGAWSIVIPKVATTPIWLLGVRCCQSWKASAPFSFHRARSIITETLPILATEAITALRLNADNFLVGSILGVEALGLYYFIFNAGVGFSLSVTSAVSNTLYPTFVKAMLEGKNILKTYDTSIKTVVLPACMIIACQALAANYYVPIVFGEQWRDAAGLVAVLCASAITKPLYDSAAVLLRARGRVQVELFYSILLTAAVLVALALRLPEGLASGVTAISAVAMFLQVLAAAHIRYCRFDWRTASLTPKLEPRK